MGEKYTAAVYRAGKVG